MFFSWEEPFDGSQLIRNLNAYVPKVIGKGLVLHERILRQLVSITTSCVPLYL